MMRLANKTVAGLATAVTLGVGATALAAVNNDEPRSVVGTEIPAESVVPAPAPINEVSADQRQLAVFRRARQAKDEVPTQLRQIFSKGRAAGEQIDLARVAVRSQNGRSYFVIPGSKDLVCISNERGGGGCSSVAAVKAGRLFGTEACVAGNPNVYALSGLAPDGASVQLKWADGHTQAVAIDDNAYVAELDRSKAPPTTVHVTFADGTSQDHPTNVPRDIAAPCSG